MNSAPGRPFAQRLKSVAIFLALVWAVAASFIAFDFVGLAATDMAVAYPGVFGNVSVTGSATRSTLCDVTTPDPTAASLAIPPAQARAGAWSLGLKAGRDAQVAQSTTVTADVRAGSRAGVEQIATLLATPAPVAFKPQSLSTSNIEFVNTIEADTTATARTLAARYSPDACRLFKLGAVWGYSTMSRPFLPGQLPPLAAELRYYAQQTELPESLWRPMAAAPSASAKADEIFAESQTVTQAVTTYLLGQ